MSVYHKFEEYDLLYSLIDAQPRIVMASGSHGWRGNTGPSSSLSLYEGVRGRTDVYAGAGHGIEIYPLDQVDTHSIDRVIYVSGSYPSTGSVRFVKCRKGSIEDLSVIDPFLYNESTLLTADDWYEEHFNPIDMSFEYYSRLSPEYFTGSYDYYSFYLKQNVAFSASHVWFSGSKLPTVTSSFTLSAQIKPTATGGLGRDFTIQSQFQKFKFYLTGSSGQLAFSDYRTTVTSSVAVPLGLWRNVALVVGGGSASFYVDGRLDVRRAFTGTLDATTSSLLVGAEHVLSGSGAVTSYHNGFSGFIFDSQVWNVARSAVQVSASAQTTLFDTGSLVGLIHYARFNDGPLSTRHGFSRGSGTFDHGQDGVHGRFRNIATQLPLSPTWQPNDNDGFVTRKDRIDDEVTMFRVLHVPAMFYGRQIATGSIRMECHAYSNQGLVRVLVDDGRGSLYLSGSICRPISGEEHGGVTWRKVGNVFYSEGLVVVTDPCLLDFGGIDLDSAEPNDTLQVNFRGLERISTRTFMCRIPAGEANASNNPTFVHLNPVTQRYEMNRPGAPTWITAVGLYDDEHCLVGVAKLAQPIRKQGKLDIRLRFDF